MITEREKYQKCWAHEGYGQYSPGEQAVPLFRQMVRNYKGLSLVDLGCGTGRASVCLAAMGFEVTLMDFASEAALDPGTKGMPFIEQDLTGFWPKKHWDWGYCCDVMEHLPPNQVDVALERITLHCDQVFLSIHFGPDHFGKVVGHPLHLTVMPFPWWKKALATWGELVEARDLMGMGVFRLRSHRG